MATTPLSREFIIQRDLKIYQMRAAGMSHADIAKNLDVSIRAVTTSITRTTRKYNKEASYAYPEVLRLELDRLDKLQASVWPLAHARRIQLPDGTEITVEPDLQAVQTILKISQDRRKLLGMDVQKVSINMEQDVRHTLVGASTQESKAIDSRSETVALLELMIESRIIEADVGEELLKELSTEIIVEPEESLAIGPGEE